MARDAFHLRLYQRICTLDRRIESMAVHANSLPLGSLERGEAEVRIAVQKAHRSRLLFSLLDVPAVTAAGCWVQATATPAFWSSDLSG
jgi:hypothetical protein